MYSQQAGFPLHILLSFVLGTLVQFLILCALYTFLCTWYFAVHVILRCISSGVLKILFLLSILCVHHHMASIINSLSTLTYQVYNQHYLYFFMSCHVYSQRFLYTIMSSVDSDVYSAPLLYTQTLHRFYFEVYICLQIGVKLESDFIFDPWCILGGFRMSTKFKCMFGA